MEPNIELSKTRDFGEIISDSFLFIRQNLKPLLSCFFVFCGFFLLAGTVAIIMQQIKMVDVLNNTDYAGDNASNFAAFGVETALTLIFTLLTYVAMPVAILSFMALYKVKGNVAPTNEEVWGYFKYYFFRILGSSLLNFIILIIGFALCLIPGIYFYPVLSLIIPIMIVENTGYGYAFNESFRLIKQNWWRVFGVLIITSIIVSICAAVVTVPFQAVNVWNVFLHKIEDVHLSILTIIIGTILRQLAQVLYILPMVALAMCYFSLTEDKDATGLMGRIDQLGNKSADTNTPAEEY
ncbi:MAG: hypothetical protein V4592_08765 [Bacteroidota bacterium]